MTEQQAPKPEDNMFGSFAFIFNINGHPLFRFSEVAAARVQAGKYVPALRAESHNGQQPYFVDIPVLALDLKGKENMEELRKQLHDRVDATFNDFYQKYEAALKAQEEAAAQKKGPQIIK